MGRKRSLSLMPGTSMDMNILIVDDSSVMRKILERARAYQQWCPEALAMMPGRRAQYERADFLRNMKETAHKDLPVIMVTTEGGERTVKEAISLGARGFIRKPFTPQQMESTLAKVMK